jgi:ATPases with chaperone activity, ATP-binding subunit
MTDKAKAWLGKKGFDADYGARPLARVIQEHVKKPMADELLFGDLKRGGAVKVDLNAEANNGAGELTFEYFIAPEPEPVVEDVETDGKDETGGPDEKTPVT